MILPFIFIVSLPFSMALPAPTAYAPSTHAAEISNGPSIQLGEHEITAYSSSVDETDDTPNINARGTAPKDGSIACPRYYELGTKFRIEGKIYECDDRMSVRFPDRFDIWLPSKALALEHGIKTLNVELVEE
jgi:3D (Asp-Asp-Asp) domain-containing protein